jgi:pimeloyl-ACP methyl ester carboxylesterase
VPVARVNGIDIAYGVAGAGDPLLMIMGFTGARHHWYGFDKRMSLDFLTITLDNRGAGETSAPDAAYTVPQMADDAIGLLDHLGIDRVHLFGVSMGGMIAQEIALNHPGRVRTLILGCTHFGGTEQVLPAPDVFDRIGVIAGKGAEQATRDILSVNLTPKFMKARPDVVEELVRFGLEHRMKKEGFAGQMAAVSLHDTASRLHAITAPTLVIAGDEDELIPPQNSVEIAGRIKQAQITLLPGIGHMFWIEAPEEAEFQIKRFIRAQRH